MNNELFLKQMKNNYDSLKNFEIINDRLILKLESIFMINLISTKLYTLNPNLFLLEPKEIFQIIYMLELLTKKTLTNNEIVFVESFTKKYLDLNKLHLEENNIDINKLYWFEYPIVLANNNEYMNNESNIRINRLIEEYNNNLESGRGNSMVLKLTKNNNPNFEMEEIVDNAKNLEKAGFATIILITSTIAATCMYLAYFIMGH